ncbi:MAG TPA: methionyl-tRNA formyltransferase, partial [Patescibacteria group bacterium]|nr:methionyl-tRNA formyltransferase [Patescibacteria group bacterium]
YLEIAIVAKKHNIPVLLPDNPREIIEVLAGYKPEIGVLVAYGKIIPQSIIDLFPYGILNLHPSLLPIYRGPTPIEQAILDGASKTGVSIMQLVKAMDAGPIYDQKEVVIKNYESKQELTEHLLISGGKLMIETLEKVLSSSLAPNPQNEASATYTSLIDKKNGMVDWHKPAIELERQIRAFATWPQSRATIYSQSLAPLDVIITAANLDIPYPTKLLPGQISYRDGQLLVGTATTPLQIVTLKVPGKNELTAQAFANGYLTKHP